MSMLWPTKNCELCKAAVVGPADEWCPDCLENASVTARAEGFEPHEFYATLPIGMQRRVRQVMKENNIPLGVVGKRNLSEGGEYGKKE